MTQPFISGKLDNLPGRGTITIRTFKSLNINETLKRKPSIMSIETEIKKAKKKLMAKVKKSGLYENFGDKEIYDR